MTPRKGRGGSEGRSLGRRLSALQEELNGSSWIYHVLLLSLFVAFLVQPFQAHIPLGDELIQLITVGIVAVGVVAVSGRPVLLALSLLFAFPAPFLRLARIVNLPAIAAADLATVGLLLIITGGLLYRLFKYDTVKPSTVSGIAAIYLLLGLAWAQIYVLVETVHPCSFNNVACVAGAPPGSPPHPDAAGALLYFSFVTISTLGYGDISPTTEAGRTFASMEAIVGQLYLAIILARMVGIMAVRKR